MEQSRSSNQGCREPRTGPRKESQISVKTEESDRKVHLKKHLHYLRNTRSDPARCLCRWLSASKFKAKAWCIHGLERCVMAHNPEFHTISKFKEPVDPRVTKR